MAKKVVSDDIAATVPATVDTRELSEYFVSREGDFDHVDRQGWSFFLKAYKVVTDTIDRELRANTVVSLAEFELLFYVVASGGRARFIDLAKLSLLSQSRISRQIDAMRAKGFLLREATDSDRRATFAVLTVKGQSAFAEAEPVFATACHDYFLSIIGRKRLPAFSEMMFALMRTPDFGESSMAIMERARADRQKA